MHVQAFGLFYEPGADWYCVPLGFMILHNRYAKWIGKPLHDRMHFSPIAHPVTGQAMKGTIRRHDIQPSLGSWSRVGDRG